MCIKSLGLGRGSTMDIVTRQRRRAFRNRVWIVQIRLFPKAEGRGIGGRARRMGLGVSFVGERERRTQLKGQRGGAEREGKRESSHS